MLAVAAVLTGTSPTAQAQTPQRPPAGSPDAFELSFWDTIKNSRNPEDFKAYLEAFPNGRFVPLARIRAAGAAAPGDSAPSASTPSTATPSASRPPASTGRPGGANGAVSTSPPPGGGADPGAATPPPTEQDAGIEALEGDYVTTAATPILEGPDRGARRLGTLRRGETVRVTGRVAGGQTYRVLSADGRTGYVAADRLKAADAPAAAAATTVQPGGALTDCPDCPEMVPLPAGTFEMGSNEFFEFEKPVHKVTLARGFLIGRREVTIREWTACVTAGACVRQGEGASSDPTDPVTDITWSEARAYADWLSSRTGKRYRLPTEAEWEYAARAGATTTYPWGQTLVRERANCLGCNAKTVRRPVATGSFAPNGFGLFDMAGNAAEWVQDCWTDNYKGAPGDGAAREPAACRERVLRGGSFANDPRYLRSAARFKYDAEVRYYANGFRVARDE